MSDTEKDEPSEFDEQLAKVTGGVESMSAELADLAQLHTDEVSGLEQELEESQKQVTELEDELESDEGSTGRALALLFRTGDGRRLIERAFLANPGRTAMELSYLGGDAIRGELEVSVALTKQQVTPLAPPPVRPGAPTLLKRMPRA